jgi:DNA (cytosine-5)-methyltransferase 1
MKYASVCDGIGAVHVAWKHLGWKCDWTSEIEPFPAAVVEHHHRLKNLGDMAAITEETLNGIASGPIDLLVGGTPCQSFSVAGLRRGLDDPRGNLALRFLQLAGVLRPTWVVWENVPGVLSSAGGRDFGTFLGALGELGYGFAYRVLDAQWFGVAQRRRRVFVVGHARDWRCAAAVLFERESLCGNPPSRGQARKDVAGSLVARSGRNGGASNADVDSGQLIFGGNNQSGPIDVAPSCLAHGSPHGRQDFASEAFVVSDDPTHAICANEQRTYTNEGNVFQLRNVVAQPYTLEVRGRDGGRNLEYRSDGTANCLRGANGGRDGMGGAGGLGGGDGCAGAIGGCGGSKGGGRLPTS